jgi:hypothetical protein
VLTIDRRASITVPATPERCIERLSDAERYPSWASLIKRVEVVDDRLRITAELMGIVFVMDCVLLVEDGAVALRRIPYSDDDEERYEASWTVAPAVGGTRVELHVLATVDAPGPARLVRGQVERRLADGLVGDFERSL